MIWVIWATTYKGSFVNNVVKFLGIFDPFPPPFEVTFTKLSFDQHPTPYPLKSPSGLWMSPLYSIERSKKLDSFLPLAPIVPVLQTYHVGPVIWA